MFTEGESVALHTIEDDDLEFLRRWRNDPAVRRPLTVNEPSNGEQTERFFEDAISADEDANFLICVADRREATEEASGEGRPVSSVADRREATEEASGEGRPVSSVADRREATEEASGEGRPASSAGAEPVGMISLFDEDRTAGTATIAYWVVPDARGNGYATDATDLVCEHAFADRRLHKVRADVLHSNEGSRRVLEKAGFEREGVLREEKFVGGEHVDVYRYGLLAADWRAE